MRVGIMGGTFNPIHNGHIFIADAARRAVRLERVLFIPAGNPPHKHGLADAEARFAMTALALEGLDWAEASRLETDRAGTIYTVDTLGLLSEAYPGAELFVIVGADTLRDMPTWRDAPRAMRLCELVAVTRPGFDEEAFIAAERTAREQTGARVTPVHADSPDISSSSIRGRVAAGRDIAELVPAKVAEYIAKEGLYL